MNRWIELETKIQEEENMGTTNETFFSEEEMNYMDKVVAGLGVVAASAMALLLVIHLILNMLKG